jgi:glycosyltransferase involved in cell wall biosynthesis
MGASESSVLVGIVARMHPMKDHETFLRAAAIIHEKRPDVQFVVAGRGTRESDVLRGLILQMGLGQCLHLIGERRDAPRLVSALDVLVSSSDSGEGFPNIVLEAMGAGTPCVVTDTGDSALVVADTGLVVQPKNPGALAEATLRLLGLDAAARHELGTRARARALNEFSVATISRQYQDLYIQLAELAAGGS